MSDNESIQLLRRHAVEIFQAGLQAVKPENAVNKHCSRQGDRLTLGAYTYDLRAFKKIYVVGAGKASAPMARAVEALIGDKLAAGIVVTKYGHTDTLRHIRIIEAGHPIPDANGAAGALQIMELVRTAGASDLVLGLISGGGSALMALPAAGLTLADKQATHGALIDCGAAIHEINAVRKHISGIKGGRMAEAVWPAAMVTLILSDVVGDDLDVIASGPTVADQSTFAECQMIFEKYAIQDKIPARVQQHIQAGIGGTVPETLKQASAFATQTRTVLIGTNAGALAAAEAQASAMGYHTLILSSMIQGETRAIAPVYGAIAREILRFDRPAARPACILSGGETTVTIRGNGKGGRNQEFALAVAEHINLPQHPIVFMSVGTDGTDGPTDAAGAIADATTAQRARAAGLDLRKYLNHNDAWHFFSRLGDLLITGPTRTNVMDLQVLLVG